MTMKQRRFRFCANINEPLDIIETARGASPPRALLRTIDDH